MEEKEEPEVQMRVVVFYLGLAEGLGRVGVEQVNPGQAVTGSQADYGGQRMPATAEQNGGMNHERIQGGSQIGGDSGQIARAADDGQLAARTAGPADSGQRDAGLGSDRQAGGLGEGTGSTAVRSGERGSQRAAEQARLRNQIRSLEAERTSAKAIGIQGGTKNESLRVIPEELYTSEMREIANEVAELGQTVTFVAGPMEVRGRTGKPGRANGIHQVNRDGSVQYFIRADSAKYTAGTLFKHESFHELVSGNQNLWLDMVEDLFKTHTEEEVYMMVDAYVEALDGIYGVYEEGMTEDKQAALRNKYLEEIFADQYAGMNRGGGKQAAARGVAGETAQRFAGDIENARQNRAGIENRNGPGTRFVYSEEEAQEMQDEGITVTSGPSALDQKADKKPVSQVLAESVSELENMQPLAHLTGHEMNDRSKTLDQQIREWFASFGNVVSREAFGDILFQEYGVGGVMNHKPLNRAKLVTLIAAKDVVVHGKVISYEENHKGRGYPSYIFAGPVTIGPQNTKIYVAAVVDVRSGNKFYFNECVDSAGNYVRINEGTQGNTKTGVTVQDGVTRRPSEPSINNIAQNSEIDKRQGTKNSEDDATVDWNGNRVTEGKQLRIYDKERAIEYLKDKGYKAELTDNYHSGDIVSDIQKIVKSEKEGVDWNFDEIMNVYIDNLNQV